MSGINNGSVGEPRDVSEGDGRKWPDRSGAGLGSLSPYYPGLTALPAVSVLTQPSWRHRVGASLESWTPGELISLAAMPASAAPRRSFFFTPVADFRFPQAEIDIMAHGSADSTRASFSIRSPGSPEALCFQFVVLPWSQQRDDLRLDLQAKEELVRRCADGYLRGTTVELRGAGGVLRATPEWGLSTHFRSPSLESLRFCFNHASCLLGPIILRVQFARSELLRIAGDKSPSDQYTLALTTPTNDVCALYAAAGMTRPDPAACSFVANAMPVLNVDLRAWLHGQTYGEFRRQIDARPLGAAGVFAWHQDRPPQDEPHILGSDSLFHYEVDSKSGALLRYWTSGGLAADRDRQLLVWVTAGMELNGHRFEYKPRPEQQPRERESRSWIGAITPLPAMGGYDVALDCASDCGFVPALTLGPAPQMFAHRGSIAALVKCLLLRLGYQSIRVDGPVMRPRLVNGLRTLVSVLTVIQDSGRGVAPSHRATVAQYISEMEPIGCEIQVDYEGA